MSTRRIAAQVLSRVLDDGQSLTTALDSALAKLESAKERAFVQALCYGVCRYFYRLDFILSQLLDKPLKDTDIKALALVGLYQLIFMRVKPHAAISETVSAVGKKTWAKGLINALLRNYLRLQDKLDAKAEKNLSAATSHPDWLLEQITHSWPEHAPQIFAENNLQAPMSLRVNLSKISRDDYLQQLNLHTISATIATQCLSAITLDKPAAVELLPGFAEGWFSVQDCAAQLAAELLDVQAGDRVLDVCAAPGGKTAHILETQPDVKELVAIDIDATRMRRVSDNLQRLQCQATQIIADATRPQDWWDKILFERILLDAPCSALGVIRRHPDIKLLRRPDDIAALQALQQALLQAIWPLLAQGGTLVYATCSVLKQENEQQAAAFLATHPDAIEWPITSAWGVTRPVGKQIITGDLGMDGFYYARFKKQ
ncbi:16S rRNA (cytosine(967)-C(5))-methyltransferase RsmB [Crenothrix polyspora]|uniref:16S rRNA (cytosine(967)-C(5))-methyltransferase n=1 Tax=Crenothrix polyspora TaxID=360316 RepID=A0A1R4HBL2_9GAMM|nr:16S rRNA (cytosine(967)-C(5))-methyltransferase RsmB [Crenothrix polyspora]SJM93652.1 16S rRNA m5C967 methyltransferase, S-adenosyl-L-methionine-dependent [Crenothrix polyspora]